MWMCQPDNPPNIKLDTESFNLFKSGGPSVMIDGAVVNKTFGHGLLSPQVLKKTTGCGQCYLIESIDMYSPGAACGPCCGESKCTQKYQVKDSRTLSRVPTTSYPPPLPHPLLGQDSPVRCR